ncbi:MAG TPA: hypothetical protein ENI20_04645 [Bacteroides sp.]|nr:hypothetical protein [Bacteroides sp.]
MKNKVLFLLGMTMSVMTYGHSNPAFRLKEMGNTPPEFKLVGEGHETKSINEYLAKSVQYPQGTASFGLLGTEVVEFVITASGELTDLHVINSISLDIDKEVIKVLQETSGKWNPGIINGVPANMKQEISVVYKPNANYNLDKIANNFYSKGIDKLLVDKDPKKALKNFNRAVSLLPYEESFLAARSLCKFELGDEVGARQDWDRIITLYKSANPQFRASKLNQEMNHLKGFAEMSQLLK